MRIFRDFREANSELKRDLKEMGIKIHPQTYQDKFVGDDPNFRTQEITDYIYTVTGPKLEDLDPEQPWASQEWLDRLSGILGAPLNPGKSWEKRKDIWKDLMEMDGQGSGSFSYTYSERYSENGQVGRIINRLKEDHGSRQCFMSIWRNSDIENIGGKRRIPCSLGYQFRIRGGSLHMTYIQRSADVATHLSNDQWLSLKLQSYVAEKIDRPVGNFTHWIGSLHVFQKDIEGVF